MKKIILLILFLPLFGFGQINFFTSTYESVEFEDPISGDWSTVSEYSFINWARYNIDYDTLAYQHLDTAQIKPSEESKTCYDPISGIIYGIESQEFHENPGVLDFFGIDPNGNIHWYPVNSLLINNENWINDTVIAWEYTNEISLECWNNNVYLVTSIHYGNTENDTVNGDYEMLTEDSYTIFSQYDINNNILNSQILDTSQMKGFNEVETCFDPVNNMMYGVRGGDFEQEEYLEELDLAALNINTGSLTFYCLDSLMYNNSNLIHALNHDTLVSEYTEGIAMECWDNKVYFISSIVEQKHIVDTLSFLMSDISERSYSIISQYNIDNNPNNIIISEIIDTSIIDGFAEFSTTSFDPFNNIIYACQASDLEEEQAELPVFSFNVTTFPFTASSINDYYLSNIVDNDSYELMGVPGATFLRRYTQNISIEYVFNLPNDSSQHITACDTYNWNGNTYDSSGTYIYVTKNIISLDSTVTLNLTINSSNGSTDTQEHCDSYIWLDNVEYTESNNTATMTYTNVSGCDSIVTLDLTINNSNGSTDTHVACDSFMWNCDGNTYTSSNNTATYIYTNVSGCDSIVTLDLTINNSNGSTDTQEHCDSYTWLDNVEYTESNNTATKTYTNTSGCDSIVTLDLTINNSNGSTDIQEHCDSYMWLDSNIYTVSNNTATMTYTNTSGCDSVVTLDLTINTVIASIDQDGDSLFAITTPIEISETANWYNTQTTIEDTITTTKIWLMEEGSATFKPRFDCSYFIVVADESGCVDTSEVYNFGSSASRIGSLITSPNPSNGLVNVQFENSKNQFVKLELMNGQGAKLDEFVSTDSEMNIDLSKYPSGTYYLYFDSRHTVKGCFDEQKEMIMNKIILNK